MFLSQLSIDQKMPCFPVVIGVVLFSSVLGLTLM